MLPNFIIVGAAKCGTTSLYNYLSQHHETCMAPVKEPAFFSGKKSPGIDNISQYRDLFRSCNQNDARGEASTLYLPDEKAPINIKSLLGQQTKILILLRNPIDMIYSLWGHRCRVGANYGKFIESVKYGRKETKKMDNDSLIKAMGYIEEKGPYPYIQRALYSEQVKRYTEKFTDVKTLVYEDFFENPRDGYETVCKYLKISTTHKPNFKKYNVNSIIVSKKLHSIINSENGLKKVFKKFVPPNMRNKIKSMLRAINKKSVERETLPKSDRRKLASIFAEDVSKLSQIVNHNLIKYWNDFDN